MWSTLLLLAGVLSAAYGHGRVMDPPSRASAWRVGFPTIPDYDDDGANCGGFAMQWSANGGKCGICGDPYQYPPPRPHELGGVYGQGIIVAHYQPGSVITTTVDLTTSHKGFWQFKLCPDPESNNQDCFDKHVLELEQGDTKFYPNRGSTKYNVNYRLPPGVICDHCVLQWRYTAGNNWGDCQNGTQGLGCGNQEQFGACSDISIGVSRQNQMREQSADNYDGIPYPLFYYLRHGYFDAQQGLLNLLKRGFVRPQHSESTQKQSENRQKNSNNRQKSSGNRQISSGNRQISSDNRQKPSGIGQKTSATGQKVSYRYNKKLNKRRKQKNKIKHRKRKKKMPYWT